MLLSCKLARLSVALLAEGVDRNIWSVLRLPDLPLVALLAEGVDRNSTTAVIC